MSENGTTEVTMETALAETPVTAPIKTEGAKEIQKEPAVAETAKVEAKVETKEEVKEEPITRETLARALEEAKATVKGGYEGTLKEIQSRNKQLQQEYNNALAQLAEVQNENFLKQVEAQGGDVNVARQIVERAKITAQKEQEIANAKAQLDEERASIQAIRVELDLAAKGKKINDLIIEYALPITAKSELAKAKDATEMELKAAKMAMKKSQIEAKPATKVATESGAGTSGADLSKLSAREQLEFAIKNS